jgi:hypothetical protein
LQIYTHAAVGLLAGIVVFPHNAPAQIACIAGADGPDNSIPPSCLAYRWKNRQPSFANWPRGLIFAEAMHSIPLWCVASLIIERLFIIGIGGPYLLAFLLGGLSHAMVDSYTHGGRGHNIYTANDNVGFLWPWKFKLGRILGFYEYRDPNYPGLLPKWPEAMFLSLVIVAIVWLYIHH